MYQNGLHAISSDSRKGRCCSVSVRWPITCFFGCWHENNNKGRSAVRWGKIGRWRPEIGVWDTPSHEAVSSCFFLIFHQYEVKPSMLARRNWPLGVLIWPVWPHLRHWTMLHAMRREMLPPGRSDGWFRMTSIPLAFSSILQLAGHWPLAVSGLTPDDNYLSKDNQVYVVIFWVCMISSVQNPQRFIKDSAVLGVLKRATCCPMGTFSNVDWYTLLCCQPFGGQNLRAQVQMLYSLAWMASDVRLWKHLQVCRYLYFPDSVTPLGLWYTGWQHDLMAVGIINVLIRHAGARHLCSMQLIYSAIQLLIRIPHSPDSFLIICIFSRRHPSRVFGSEPFHSKRILARGL